MYAPTLARNIFFFNKMTRVKRFIVRLEDKLTADFKLNNYYENYRFNK